MPSIIDNTNPQDDTQSPEQSSKSKSKSLKQFVKEDNLTLLNISTVFPFVFFPNTLRIDQQKVSIMHAEFLWSKREQTITITDVLAVTVDSGPLFATLSIKTKFFNQKPIRIKYLRKSEATLARRIIHGLMLVARKKLKIKESDPQKVIAMLEEVGKMG